MGLGKTNDLLRSAKEDLAEGQMFSIGSGGLTPVKTGRMTMQVGTMYPMGASTSPNMILMTKVSDDRLLYKNYPWTKGTKEMVIDRRIGEDLIYRGTLMWLKGGYPKYQPGTAKSLRSMLNGGKGKKENLANLEQVTILASAANPSKKVDLWRNAEEYGNVAGIDDPKTGIMNYEIEGTVADLNKIKKDKRFKILKIKKGRR